MIHIDTLLYCLPSTLYIKPTAVPQRKEDGKFPLESFPFYAFLELTV